MKFIELDIEQNIARITLNRPEKLNAFTGTMREDLVDALTTASSTTEVRVIAIRGAGRAFCSGGDVDAMSRMQASGATADFMKLLEAGKRIVTTIRSIEQPVIAIVNGVAAGAGCNLALACDYRLASSAAKIGQTFTKIGLHPDWGGTFFLPRLVGPSRAMELMISGRLVDAREALAIGLVDAVADAEQLDETAERLLQAFAAAPPLAVRGIKRAVYSSFNNSLGAQVDLESEHQLRAFQSDDSREGMAAFFEKRAAAFTGK